MLALRRVNGASTMWCFKCRAPALMGVNMAGADILDDVGGVVGDEVKGISFSLPFKVVSSYNIYPLNGSLLSVEILMLNHAMTKKAQEQQSTVTC